MEPNILSKMQDKLFDTRDIDVNQRIDYWQYAISEVFVPLECAIDSAQNFWGNIDTHSNSTFELARVQGASQHIERRKHKNITTEKDHVLLSVMLKGNMGLIYNEKRVIVSTGEFAFYDTTQEYDLNLNHEFDQIVISIPRQECERYLGRIDQICGISFGYEHPLQRLIHQYLKEFLISIQHLSQKQQDLMSEHILNMLSCIMSDQHLNHQKDKKSMYLFEQIECYILKNLNNISLDIHHIAHCFKVSTRYISKLFQMRNTTFGQFLLLNRLKKIKYVLQSTSHQSHSIQQIAYGAGFVDMSYFSREFKRIYGVTPSEFRSSTFKKCS